MASFNHSYNKYGDTLRGMFTELVNHRIVNENPLWQKKNLDVPESNKYEPYTEEEKKAISKHLHKRHFNLYRVMQVVYHTGIRPKEVVALKISEVRMDLRMIVIAPEEERENSKTNNLRYVPINPHLYELLEMMHLDKYPGDWFVFGSPFQPGKGNRGAGSQKRYEGVDRPGALDDISYGFGISGAMRNDFLMPSANEVKRARLQDFGKC